LSARSIAEARRATIFAAVLKQLPLFIFVLPGVIAFALAEQGRLTLTDPDGALPSLIAAVLPIGLKGLVVAGLLAALMSSLSSVFNSCATLITMDVYRRIAPEASERRLVLVGQIATVLMVVFGLLWIPFMDAISGTLYVYLQSVQSYISPPIAAVFLVGVLWRRANAKGAVVALGAGLVLGVGRLVLEVQAGELQGVLLTFATINFLHFAVLLFLVSVALLVVVSLWSEAPGHEVDTLTWAGRGAGPGTVGRRSFDVVVSVGVVALVVLAWISFA
jgi:SSS family solute:Na+ symporter